MMTQSKNKTRSRPKSALLFALAALATSATFASADVAMSEAAHAAEPEAFPTQKVYSGDLDLATEMGVAKLHSRIYRAAKNVCGVDQWPLSPRNREVRKCIAVTTSNAMKQANRKVALYRAHAMAND